MEDIIAESQGVLTTLQEIDFQKQSNNVSDTGIVVKPLRGTILNVMATFGVQKSYLYCTPSIWKLLNRPRTPYQPLCVAEAILPTKSMEDVLRW